MHRGRTDWPVAAWVFLICHLKIGIMSYDVWRTRISLWICHLGMEYSLISSLFLAIKIKILFFFPTVVKPSPLLGKSAMALAPESKSNTQRTTSHSVFLWILFYLVATHSFQLLQNEKHSTTHQWTWIKNSISSVCFIKVCDWQLQLLC